MKKGLWMGILWILLGMLCSYGKSWKTLEFQNGSSLISNQNMEQEKSILEKRIKDYGYSCQVIVDEKGVKVKVPENADVERVRKLVTNQGDFYLISQYGKSGAENFSANHWAGTNADGGLKRTIHEVMEDEGIIVKNNNMLACVQETSMNQSQEEISIISCTLDEQGKQAFADATRKACDNKESIGFYLGGTFYSVAVTGYITDGRFVITNLTNEEDARVTCCILRSGILPYPLEEVR